jgi:hypothetical protein
MPNDEQFSQVVSIVPPFSMMSDLLAVEHSTCKQFYPPLGKMFQKKFKKFSILGNV